MKKLVKSRSSFKTKIWIHFSINKSIDVFFFNFLFSYENINLNWMKMCLKGLACKMIDEYSRVKTLSLTSHIVRWFASVTLVQWPELAERYKRTTYIGRIS